MDGSSVHWQCAAGGQQRLKGDLGRVLHVVVVIIIITCLLVQSAAVRGLGYHNIQGGQLTLGRSPSNIHNLLGRRPQLAAAGRPDASRRLGCLLGLAGGGQHTHRANLQGGAGAERRTILSQGKGDSSHPQPALALATRRCAAAVCLL